MSNPPAGLITIRNEPVGNIRRAIVSSPTLNFVLDNSGPVPLPARLDHLVHTAALTDGKRTEIRNLYRLYEESGRAQQYVVPIRDNLPPARQPAAYEALGKTMRNRDGIPVRAATYQYITNLRANARDNLLARIIPLFRTTTGHQDVVVRCTELDGILLEMDALGANKWAVYLSVNNNLRQQLGMGAGLSLRDLDDLVGRNKVLQHSAWAYDGQQLRHAVPTNPLSAPVFGGAAGVFAPFPMGPTMAGMVAGTLQPAGRVQFTKI